MTLWRLRLAVVGTLSFIFAISTLFFAALMVLIGGLSIFALIPLVVFFNVIQWVMAPSIINRAYRVKNVTKAESPKLYGMVENLAQKTQIKMPKVGIANIPIPNAFAYSSPRGGSHIAVTSELVRNLEDEEIEAVIGHELGHLKHRDAQVMMFVSVLPAIFYFIGWSLFLSSMWGGMRRGGSGGGLPILIGAASMAMYFVLTLFVMYLSRLREYYADRNSVSIVEDGARKLSEGLAKIVAHGDRLRIRGQDKQLGNLNSFRTLFISDPTRAQKDTMGIVTTGKYRGLSDQQLVKEIVRKKITGMDRVLELFSSHPNIVKRIRSLRRLQYPRVETL